MIEQITKHFQVYKVGGCVRDELLNISHADIDYCVVASREQFESLFPQLECVGRCFPVYLNPSCGSEIALSRSEISTGHTYQDFECVSGVSIEEDLSRRDATMNSIAKCVSTGTLIDPFNGIQDIQNKIVRTINKDAFIEDPLRILRLCRQAVQFGFDIEPHTKQLMKESVHRLIHIPSERVVAELQKMYIKCEVPSTFFRLLYELDALRFFFIELKKCVHVPAGPEKYHPEGSTFNHIMNSFDSAKANGYSFSVAIAALSHDFGKLSTDPTEYPSHINHENRLEHLENFLERLKFDSYTQKLSRVVHKNHMKVHILEKIKKPVKLIRFIRSIRKEFRDDFIKACNCDSPLSATQLEIYSNIRKAVDTTVELPSDIKGTEAIQNYVENFYTKKYLDICKQKG
jgi:tRNA nucleotidyltransferase (CCA-adding enzyme)